MSELERLLRGGVVGGGGAGFPLWKKLSAPAEQLLINGAECEPLLKSDQYLIRRYAPRLVEAASRLAAIVGAREAVVCLKDHYTEQIAALKEALERDKALVPPVRVHLLPTVYPIGDEQALVHSATGKTVPPGGLPGAVGCTVVSVSTALNALRALDGKPVTRRFVTVAGEVGHPGVYRVPVGMPVSLLLEQAGGARTPEHRLILGGPMMGPLAPEGGESVVTKTLGGVLVLPREHTLVRHAELSMEQARVRARSACIQCRTCTDLCPRHLLGHPIYPHLTMRAFAAGNRLEPSAMLCMECGVCELYACPMGLNPRRIQQTQKAQLRAANERPSFALQAPPALAEYHQAPSGRVLARINAAKYDMPVPDEAIEASTDLVCIPLKQHIGAPAEACVAVGDAVRRGDVIGRMADGALGADVHASICGKVERIENGVVVIRGDAQDRKGQAT